MYNIISNINSLLEAVGSDWYSIKRLTINNILKMPNYSIGIEILIKNLKPYGYASKSGKPIYFYLDKESAPNNILYRASSNKYDEAFLFSPGERVSQGTANVYNKLISDVLPSWKNFPRRNNSVICTNNYSIAEDYTEYSMRRGGVVYIVIPPDDAQLVISPRSDIWYAFSYIKSKTGLVSLRNINDSILKFLAFFDNFINNQDLINNIYSQTYNMTGLIQNIRDKELLNIEKYENLFTNVDESSIVAIFNRIDKLLSDKKFIINLLPIYKTYFLDEPLAAIGNYILNRKKSNVNSTIINILDNLFNPSKNGFEVVNYYSFSTKEYIDREIWVEDPCIFIEFDSKQFLTKLYYKYGSLNKTKR